MAWCAGHQTERLVLSGSMDGTLLRQRGREARQRGEATRERGEAERRGRVGEATRERGEAERRGRFGEGIVRANFYHFPKRIAKNLLARSCVRPFCLRFRGLGRALPMPVILATSGYDHTIRFWQASTGMCERTLQYPDSVRLAFGLAGEIAGESRS